MHHFNRLRAHPAERQARALGQRAQRHEERGELPAALQCLEELAGLYREMGKQDALADCSRHMADLVAELGDNARALALYGAAERYYRETGARKGLQGALADQALIQAESRETLPRALELMDESERLCCESQLMCWAQTLVSYRRGYAHGAHLSQYPRSWAAHHPRPESVNPAHPLCYPLSPRARG